MQRSGVNTRMPKDWSGTVALEEACLVAKPPRHAKSRNMNHPPAASEPHFYLTKHPDWHA